MKVRKNRSGQKECVDLGVCSSKFSVLFSALASGELSLNSGAGCSVFTSYSFLLIEGWICFSCLWPMSHSTCS